MLSVLQLTCCRVWLQMHICHETKIHTYLANLYCQMFLSKHNAAGRIMSTEKIPMTSSGFFFKLCLYWFLYLTELTGWLFLTGLFVSYSTVSPPALVSPWGGEGVCFPKMYGGILITFVFGCNESGADAGGGGAIAHPGTFLLWVSWLLDGTLSSGQNRTSDLPICRTAP